MDRKDRGLSLLELIFVIAISAVIGMLSVGPLSNFYQSTQIRTAIYQTIRSINHARQLAVNHAKPVSLCAYTAEGNCQSLWQSNTELIIFEDSNNDEQLTGGEPVFYRQSWSTAAIKGKLAVINHKVLKFSDTGTSLSGNISLCSIGKSSTFNRKVLIYAGRPRLDNQGDNSIIQCN